MTPPPDTLPLFPLKTVLFPGGVLPLRVFEPRYMDMVTRCMREHTPFGVCLIAAGEEVGEFLGFRAVGLLVHRHGFATDEEGGLKTTVTTHNESAPLRDSDGIAPALVLDD